MPRTADDLVTRGQNVGKKRDKRLKTACFQRFHDKTVRGSIPRISTIRKPPEMAAFLLFPTVFKSSYRSTIGLAYTTDWNGKPVVTDRMHWTLAESVNTSATLATVTGKQVYKDWYAIFWKYIDEYLIDHENGSWFHQLNKDNKVIGTVWPGKSDLYHATQCTLISRLDPAVSVAPALKANPNA